MKASFDKGDQMKKRICLLLVLLFASGCMTRSVPFTPVTISKISLPKEIRYKKFITRLPDISRTDISGGHHEGLLQVRQPGFFGLSGEQKKILYGNIAEIAGTSFLGELVYQKVNLTLVEDGQSLPKADYMIYCNVNKVTLNTYGNGANGFGSAGNYWEAYVELEIVLENLRTRTKESFGKFTGYAKLDNSPAKLNWTVLDVLFKSAIATQQSLLGQVNTWRGDYSLEGRDISPVEIAGRLASDKWLLKLAEKYR